VVDVYPNQFDKNSGQALNASSILCGKIGQKKYHLPFM
jgi:hypothetical protein